MPFNSGDTCEASNNWTKGGTYDVKVMAKDVNGGESDWSDPLPVKMPRSRTSHNTLFLRLFERFPMLERLLDLIRVI